MSIAQESADAYARVSGEREIVASRVVDAPRELVFDAFTDTRHISNWWGPRGFTTTTHAFELRPGGAWRFTMHGPDGTDWPNLVVYREIQRPERLAYDHHAGDASVPPHFTAIITFDEVDGGTRVTLRSTFPTAAARDYVVREVGAVEGAADTLARFAEHLATRAE